MVSSKTFSIALVLAGIGIAGLFATNSNAQGIRVQGQPSTQNQCPEGKIELPPLGCQLTCPTGWQRSWELGETCYYCERYGWRLCSAIDPDGQSFE
jgi:hypothetical protein